MFCHHPSARGFATFQTYSIKVLFGIKFTSRLLIGAIARLGMAMHPAAADAQMDFSGKRITVIVPAGEGGIRNFMCALSAIYVCTFTLGIAEESKTEKSWQEKSTEYARIM